MSLSLDKRYEIVFLSYHAMGQKLGVKAVAKAINCAEYCTILAQQMERI